MALSVFAGTRAWPPQHLALALALVLGPRKASADPFLDHGALELGEYTHHLEHRLASRRRGVDSLLV
jgi:hypothetical protein